MEQLLDGMADVWFLRVGDSDPELGLLRELLAPEERDRASRFRFARDRRLYRASRVLLRTVLSRYADVVPDAWTFAIDDYGKPRILSPASIALEFSLSHTRGLVCCAVGNGVAIGVDAEDTGRPLDVVEIAKRCCSLDERRHLMALRRDDQHIQFLTYWTLKESLVKALGVGMSADFSRFSFGLAGGDIGVSFESESREDHAAWHFRVFRPTPTHTLGVSARRPLPDVRIRLREARLCDIA